MITSITQPRRGFSLIEVLFAVLVLSIAMLGLAAVFPQVMAQQAAAKRDIDALLVSEQSRAQITSDPRMNPAFWSFWAGLGQNTEAFNDDSVIPTDGSWRPADLHAPTGALLLGQQVIAAGANPYDLLVIVPLADRIRFDTSTVWDIAYRRAGPRPMLPTTGATVGGEVVNIPLDANRVQLAVFQRPFDSRLTKPANLTLRQAILGGTGADQRVPVSEDDNGPRDDGSASSPARYSGLALAGVQMVIRTTGGAAYDLRRIILTAETGNPLWTAPSWASIPTTLASIAGKRGQLLVDNNGNVLKVDGIENDANGNRMIVLSSPLPPGTTPASLYQVVFSPQRPVGVSVFTVNP